MSKRFQTVPLVALAFALPAAAQAQNYSDLPPLTPMSPTQVQQLPAHMRTAPLAVRSDENVTVENGVETITRTRRIENAHPAPVLSEGYGRTVGHPSPAFPAHHAYAPAYAPAYAAPVVFEREQWIEECRRRTRGQNRDNTGLIIGGLLGAIAGGFAGYEIAGAGDRVLGTVLGAGGGGLIGGLLGSLFNGDRKKNLYDCQAALDSYLSAYGTDPRIASRAIAYPAYGHGYGYPASYSYGYTYAPPPQMVMVPVRTEVQQQVVVRETVREERYTVPGATRIIDPAPRPSPKMIKQR
jgi:hypothetical protein